MNVKLAYAGDLIELRFPSGSSVDEFSPSTVDEPVGSGTFKDAFLKGGGERFLKGEKILYVINDGHRNTPTETVLGLLERIEPELIEKADYLIAAGTHGEPTEEHYHKIFGRYYDRFKSRSKFHDCHDFTSMINVGKDRFDYEVLVNRAVFEYDNIIMISSVEPHYFAGFTGGRKSVLPGLSDFATIERNHNQANSLDAAPLRLDGNPVAEHMAAVLEMIQPERLFGIQGVIDAVRNLAGVFCGELKTAFDEAVVFSRQMYARPVKDRYDLVICEVLPPLDNSLYQIQKALENCQPAVKDGGTIILLSACQGGIGSEHFFELACGWDSEKNVSKDGQLHFGSHKLSRVNSIGRRIDVRVHSTLPDETVRQVFYQPIGDIQALLNENQKDNYRIAIVRDAGHTVLTT